MNWLISLAIFVIVFIPLRHLFRKLFEEKK